MEKRNHNTAELIKIFLICLCVVLFIASFFIQQKKRHINEAKKLPFTNTNLELVEDGTYENSTFTSFMHLSLEVTVKNHQLFQIQILAKEISIYFLLILLLQNKYRSCKMNLGNIK